MTCPACSLRPGRPKDAAKREEIMHAATALFLERGYDLTSMDAVAQQAKVSKLTIYSHFADKKDLFRAIVQGRCDCIGVPENFEDAARLSVREALLKVARRILSLVYLPESLCLIRIVQSEAMRHSEIIEIYDSMAPRRLKAALVVLLEGFAAQGAIVLDDSARAADRFLSLLKGEMLQHVLMFLAPPPTAEEIETHLLATVDFFLAAVCPSSATPVKAS